MPLFVAGPPDVLDPEDPYAAFEARRGAAVVAVRGLSGAGMGIAGPVPLPATALSRLGVTIRA